MRGTLSAVVEQLSGTDRPDLLAALAALRRDALVDAVDRFRDALVATDHARAERLAEDWRALGEKRVARLLAAPALWSWSLDVGSRTPLELAERLEHWIEAETETDAGPVARWTALGDRRVGGGREAYVAPVLGNGTTVDTASPRTVEDLREVAGGAVPFAVDEARVALERITAAEAVLGAVPSSWDTLVRGQTTVIVCRNDPSSQGFSSASTRLALGRPVFRNPHLPDVTVADIVDGWVHEAVHGLLDTLELSEPLVRRGAADDCPSVPSPWTGRPLDLDTYVHAMFVWFALWHLWLDIARSGTFDAALCSRMLLRPARGFAELDVVTRLGKRTAALADGVGDTMYAVHEQVGRSLDTAPLSRSERRAMM